MSDFVSNPIRIFTALGYGFGLYNRLTGTDPSSSDSNSAERNLSRFQAIPALATKFLKTHDGPINGLEGNFSHKFNGSQEN